MEKFAVIVNKKARNAQSLTEYLKLLSENHLNYQLYETDPDQLDETIKECMMNYPALLVGGGDGTIRSAAQRCINSPILLGILPLGTMNHFCKELKLPSNAEELIQAIKTRATITIDAAEVNGNVFVNNSSIGFYPGFLLKRNKLMKFYNKWLSYIPSLIEALKHNKMFSLEIKGEKINLSLKTSFLMISNNLYSYQFPFVFVRQSFNQSILGIYYLKYGKMRLAKILWSFFSKKNYFEMEKTENPITISINSSQKVPVSLDGELMMMENNLTYKIHPKSLNLLTNNP